MRAPTTPIQLRATWVPVSTEALFSEGSSGEYEASARKRRSAETHNRKPISSFSRRLPVGMKMLERKFMMAYHTRLRIVAGRLDQPTDPYCKCQMYARAITIMPKTTRYTTKIFKL